MNKETSDIESTFFLAFAGQFVTITVSLTSQVNFSDHEGNSVETMPVFYEGILLDYDNEYYYLGDNVSAITQAIKKPSVIHIMIKDDKKVFDEILDQMPGPERKEDVN